MVTHPVCLTSNGPITLEMEKHFATMPGEHKPKAERVLEINGEHKAFAALCDAFATDKEKAAQYAKILYAQALLIAGFAIEDPVEYAKMVCELM